MWYGCTIYVYTFLPGTNYYFTFNHYFDLPENNWPIIALLANGWNMCQMQHGHNNLLTGLLNCNVVEVQNGYRVHCGLKWESHRGEQVVARLQVTLYNNTLFPFKKGCCYCWDIPLWWYGGCFPSLSRTMKWCHCSPVVMKERTIKVHELWIDIFVWFNLYWFVVLPSLWGRLFRSREWLHLR